VFGVFKKRKKKRKEKRQNPQAEIRDFESVRKIILSFGSDNCFTSFNSNTNSSQYYGICFGGITKSVL